MVGEKLAQPKPVYLGTAFPLFRRLVFAFSDEEGWWTMTANRCRQQPLPLSVAD